KAAVGSAALATESLTAQTTAAGPPDAGPSSAGSPSAGALTAGALTAGSRPDAWLSPVELDSRPGALAASGSRARCSDKGFLAMSSAEYLELLDWTARQVAPGKR